MTQLFIPKYAITSTGSWKQTLDVFCYRRFNYWENSVTSLVLSTVP